MELFLVSIGFLIGVSVGFLLGERHASIQLVKTIKPLLEQVKTVNQNVKKTNENLCAASCRLADILKVRKEIEFWEPK